MKIIAKQNVVDSDMIELYSSDRKYMIAIVHIDNFFSDPLIHSYLNNGKEHSYLNNGKELTLTLGINGEA